MKWDIIRVVLTTLKAHWQSSTLGPLPTQLITGIKIDIKSQHTQISMGPPGNCPCNKIALPVPQGQLPTKISSSIFYLSIAYVPVDQFKCFIFYVYLLHSVPADQFKCQDVLYVIVILENSFFLVLFCTFVATILFFLLLLFVLLKTTTHFFKWMHTNIIYIYMGGWVLCKIGSNIEWVNMITVCTSTSPENFELSKQWMAFCSF